MILLRKWQISLGVFNGKIEFYFSCLSLDVYLLLFIDKYYMNSFSFISLLVIEFLLIEFCHLTCYHSVFLILRILLSTFYGLKIVLFPIYAVKIFISNCWINSFQWKSIQTVTPYRTNFKSGQIQHNFQLQSQIKRCLF